MKAYCAKTFIAILTVNEFDFVLSFIHPTSYPITPFKKSLMHSWNLSFCSLNFIWEVNTQLAFPLLRVFKAGIWLLGNDNGLKFVQTTSFFCEIDST